jgi:exo beta-1,2-glucooligosaccharide sophorohydrolase (non-reducing end)
MYRTFLLTIIILVTARLTAQEYQYDYTFFANSSMPGSWFFSRVDAIPNSVVKNVDGKLPVSDLIFHTPGNSLELTCSNSPGGSWRAVIYKQNKRGMDHFEKPAALSFWLYDNSKAAGAENLPVVQLMKHDSTLSVPVAIREVSSRNWQQVTVPLDSFQTGKSPRAENFIAVVFSQGHNGKAGSCELFLDDIEFASSLTHDSIVQTAIITEAEGYAMHVDLVWEKVTDPNVHLVKIYRSENGGEYAAAGIQQPYINRYADFTGETGKEYTYRIAFLGADYEEYEGSLPVEVSTREMTDDELLTMVQEACFRYYWEGAEPNSGMARENIPGRQNMIATGASGFGIMALLVGTERNFITREESVGRFSKILDFLGKADRFHGAYPHFMNGPTGNVTPFFGNRDNGADLVETAFLVQGLLAARQYFSKNNEKERMIREKITAIWEGVEWDWFRKDTSSRFLFWHWSPDQGWVINHRLIGWNETMVVYLLAIASPRHPVPGSLYFTGFASREPVAMKYRHDWGGSMDGALYINGNSYSGIKLDVGVNNGGPLFFTHYSYMGYDPHFITDKYTNYFTNNRNIALINYNYCVANPKHYKGYGEDAWGLTACDGPYDYSADEPIPERDPGKLAPTGAIASFPYMPEESMKALKNYYYNYGSFLWGEYGFKDAFSLSQNWCSEIYMGLNQAPMVVMIENYRTGLVWKLFMQDEEIQAGLKKVTGANGE